MSFSNVVSIICIVTIIISYSLYRIIRKKHLADPEFVKKQKMKEQEYLKHEMERENIRKAEYYSEEMNDEVEEELDEEDNF